MSLLRLLSAGKSLVGLKPEAARYRMSDPRAMPRFGSGRNPFQARKTLSPDAPLAPVSSAATTPAVEAPGPVVTPKVEPVAVAAAETEPQARPEPATVAKSEWKRKLAGWIGKLRSRRQPKKPKRATPVRPARGPVQGELSLDAIQVVRNDLSDSDFEVVARKAGPTAKPAAVAPAPGQSEPAPTPTPAPDPEAARGRMAARLFCAGKT
jgi:hypothetical protein